MITASASIEIRRTPREVLEFVLDLDKYRRVDTKIMRISRPLILDEHNVGTAQYWGRFRWTPPVPDKNVVTLRPWSSLTFVGAPRQFARLFLNFEGSFRCEETESGCVVTHSYEIAFRPPLCWLYDPLITRWLGESVNEEVQLLKRHLEQTPL